MADTWGDRGPLCTIASRPVRLLDRRYDVLSRGSDRPGPPRRSRWSRRQRSEPRDSESGPAPPAWWPAQVWMESIGYVNNCPFRGLVKAVTDRPPRPGLAPHRAAPADRRTQCGQRDICDRCAVARSRASLWLKLYWRYNASRATFILVPGGTEAPSAVGQMRPGTRTVRCGVPPSRKVLPSVLFWTYATSLG